MSNYSLLLTLSSSLFICHFFAIFLISAIGTIPIGLITVSIAQKTIKKGKKAAWRMAVGATIMEFIYTYIALISLDFFSIEQQWGQYIKIAAVVIFLVLGVYHLLQKNKPIQQAATKEQPLDFLEGIVVGAMNMLIIPFWIVVGIWLESNGFVFEDTTKITIFSIGAALGALLIFWGYIELSGLIINRAKDINQYANKVIGILFLGLGVFQLIQLL